MASGGFFEESGVLLETRLPVPVRASSDRPANAASPPRDKASRKRKAARPTTSRVAGGSSAVPWFIAFAVLAGSGGAGLWGWQKYGLLSDEVAHSDEESSALADKAARLETEAMTLGAELKRARAALTAAQVTPAAAVTSLDDLAERLEQVITADRGELRREQDRLTLELVDDILFHSGAADLTDRGRVVLLALGETLNQFPGNQIWIQGHTDDVPRKRDAKALFTSNWELSAARALTVVHYLEEEALVDPGRLAAVAFGDHRPSASKRFKNRRIELVLAPMAVAIKQR